MTAPGIITITSKDIKPFDFKDYCTWLNQEIKSRAVGKHDLVRNKTYVYNDSKIKCTYVASAYGNENYYLEVNPQVWNDIPPEVNPDLVQEDGWNLVYAYLNGTDRKLIRQHIPGNWKELFKHS